MDTPNADFWQAFLATCFMKKRELMKRLRAIAADADLDSAFARQGGNHELWSLGMQRLTIPRPRDIGRSTNEPRTASSQPHRRRPRWHLSRRQR